MSLYVFVHILVDLGMMQRILFYANLLSAAVWILLLRIFWKQLNMFSSYDVDRVMQWRWLFHLETFMWKTSNVRWPFVTLWIGPWMSPNVRWMLYIRFQDPTKSSLFLMDCYFFYIYLESGHPWIGLHVTASKKLTFCYYYYYKHWLQTHSKTNSTQLMKWVAVIYVCCCGVCGD